jgi:transcriptional regulator GlxA family with amidase domain
MAELPIFARILPMHAVAAVALPAVVAFDLAIPSQIFGHRSEAGRYSFTVCALAAGQVPSTTGYAIHAEHGLEALAAADTVVVPGYWPLDDPGEEVCSALRQAAARGARVVSVCTGAFALAAAGLLDNRRATTHWHHTDELAARHPTVKVDPDVLWVDEGAVLTSAGLAAGIDLCVQLVRADYGGDAAVGVARRMVVAPHREGGQAQWLERPVPPPGDGLAVTCAWALEHLAEPLTVADLARHAGWAPRTFARRFVAETSMAPLRWLTAARLREARRLLEASDLPIEDIATRCGLGSAANLRLHLARDAGTTPTAYRAAYQGHLPANPTPTSAR